MNKTNIQNLPISGVIDSNKGNEFYNTIHLTGDDLVKAQRQVETQSEKIFSFLKSKPNEKFTKCEIKRNLVLMGKIKENTHESSISARLTDLSKDGKVLKLNEMREGFYDKPNYLWQVKPQPIISSTGIQTTLF